jgi:hypothetical protein
MKKINYIIFTNVFLILLSTAFIANGQLKFKVLFLGNSYTSVNNLPQLIYNAALSVGDTLVFDSHTPGGYQLLSHSIDNTSLSKIMTGGWHYVVMQGQSQEPIVANNDFNIGGANVYNKVKQYNPCAVVMPYVTWGRKNGDNSNCANFPVMCTYMGMDTTLRNKYINLAKFTNGELAPVSAVWQYLRQNHPTIELYQADESHPSLEGSYAAACCFYASIFKKDPTLITYNAGLSANIAAIIKDAAKTIVFDNLQVWNYKKMPVSSIQYQIGGNNNEVIFQSINYGVKQTCLWQFGDSDTSTAIYIPHTYANNGTYTVTLTNTTCDLQGLHTSIADTVIQFCNHTPTVFTTQGWLCNNDTLWTQSADSFQWYNFEQALPETKQYLANYQQYNLSGFSVKATTNACAELSQSFNQTPLFSGYYFDLAGSGNPCLGDTVPFAVRHINGFLSGFENIVWYKNAILLPQFTNQDTLFISSSGKYVCKVTNPNANCPYDTTSYTIEYKCEPDGMPNYLEVPQWNVYPNPAHDYITINCSNNCTSTYIQLYNITGDLVNEYWYYPNSRISTAELPAGMYYLRFKNSNHSALKFVKQ